MMSNILYVLALFSRNLSLQRSSHWRCTVKKVFLKISQISQENVFVGVSFNKIEGLKTWNFIKKRLQDRCFPLKFARFLRTLILKKICERLLLSSLPRLAWYVGTYESTISIIRTHVWSLMWSLFLRCNKWFHDSK